MKNQYFGDVNDYRKYGLLRALTGLGEMSTAVCWMLTPDDGRTHGKFIAYLEQPEKWRHFDPDLFDELKYLVLDRRVRDVSWAERAKILPSSHFHDELLPDDRQGRSRYFESFWHVAQDCDLFFSTQTTVWRSSQSPMVVRIPQNTSIGMSWFKRFPTVTQF